PGGALTRGRARRQLATRGLKVPIPQQRIRRRRVEDVDRRAGAWIDLEDGEVVAIDQHVEAVEPDEPEGNGKRRAGFGDRLGEAPRQRDGPDAAAIAERRPRGRRAPLPAE